MGVINNITGSFSYEQKLENARAYAEGQSFIISAAIYDSSWIFAVFLLRVGRLTQFLVPNLIMNVQNTDVDTISPD